MNLKQRANNQHLVVALKPFSNNQKLPKSKYPHQQAQQQSHSSKIDSDQDRYL